MYSVWFCAAGCWIGSECAGKALAQGVSTTSCLRSNRIYVGFPRSRAKDSSSSSTSSFVVLYSLGGGDLALSNRSRRRSQIHHRSGLNKKVRDNRGSRQGGYGRGCGNESNSVTSEPEPVEEKQQMDRTLMMSDTSSSGRSEGLSFVERMKQNPLIGFFDGAR